MSSQPQTPKFASTSIDSSSHVVRFMFLQEKQNPTPFTGLITPPESPVDSIVNREDTKDTKANSTTFAHTVYPPAQIRAMATVLAEARRNGEFPPTTSSPMDSSAVAEDYGYLNDLRDTRGDFSVPASEAYIKLRIEVTRRIRDRDDLLGEETNREEAARRIDSYLRSVQHERTYFETANTMLQRRGTDQPTQVDVDKISEEILAVVENAVEQNMAEATGPLRMHIRDMNDALVHMHLEHVDLKDQNDTYNRQIDLHYRTLEQHTDLINSHVGALNSMFEPQSRTLQASNEGLAIVSSIVNNLSQIAVNLPNAINQVVYAAVHQQAQAAIQEVMDAQQQAMLSIHEQSQQLSESNSVRSCETGSSGVDVEALASAIAKKMQFEQSESQRRSYRPRGRFGSAIRRIFRWGERHGAGERVTVV